MWYGCYVAEHMSEYIRDPHLWAEAAANKAIHKYRAISLASEFPSVAKELHPAKNDGVRPYQVHPRTNTKFLWTCSDCSHEWHAQVSSRTSGHGCPICAYRRIHRPRPGESFADLFPEVAKEWHPARNGDTQAHNNFRLTNVDTSAPAHHHIHHQPPPTETLPAVEPGRITRINHAVRRAQSKQFAVPNATPSSVFTPDSQHQENPSSPGPTIHHSHPLRGGPQPCRSLLSRGSPIH